MSDTNRKYEDRSNVDVYDSDADELISDIDSYDSDEDNGDDNGADNGADGHDDNTEKDCKKMDLKDAVRTVEERSLYVSVDRYFKKECTIAQIKRMANIIEKYDRISLRLLNWFSLKYSASMQGMEAINEKGKVEIFHVKISYKARLKAHSKKYFDPFRRGKKFDYYYDQNDPTVYLETTLCQLNFFRWLYTHKLFDYVEKNYDTLAKKMAQFEKKKKDIKTKKKEKPVKEVNKKEEVKIKVKRFQEDCHEKLVLTF